MSAPLAFIDTETTGLHADHHEIWEVALILRTDDPMPEVTNDTGRPGDYMFRWFLPVDVSKADPYALEIGGYHERHPYGDSGKGRGVVVSAGIMANTLAMLTIDAHLIGAVPSFDEERLRRLMWRAGIEPRWHYQPIDFETLIVGYLAAICGWNATDVTESLAPPWSSDELTRAIGIDPDSFERHTAMGDALWARAAWDKVMGS